MQVAQTDSQDLNSSPFRPRRNLASPSFLVCPKYIVEANSGTGTAAERDLRGRIRFLDRLYLIGIPARGTAETQVQFHGTKSRIIWSTLVYKVNKECIVFITVL